MQKSILFAKEELIVDAIRIQKQKPTCSVLFGSSVLLAKNGRAVVVLLFAPFFHRW